MTATFHKSSKWNWISEITVNSSPRIKKFSGIPAGNFWDAGFPGTGIPGGLDPNFSNTHLILADVYKTKHNDNQCKSLDRKNYKHVHKSHVSQFPPVYNHRRRHFISVTLTIILPSPRG